MNPSKTWNPQLGAIPGKEGTRFSVWAPEVADGTLPGRNHSVEVALEDGRYLPLHKMENGLWSASFSEIGPGSLYRYRLDGRDSFPDPASRYQPFGVHGPSQVISSDFAWSDQKWAGIPMNRLSTYELHVGAFSPEGTFEGVRKKLPYIADLGVTAIELMPVADFPGDRNWGYDGAALFAPARVYGTPEDLRRLVNEAHNAGLAVLLDVVYNHFGPDGAYTVCYSPYYFTSRHRTPWGDAVNFDSEQSAAVRRHFIENALHWIHEYHIDGLRLDATHAMLDDGEQHFIAELAATVREFKQDREILLIAEDHRNLAPIVQPQEEKGWGLDGVWSDDFHHEIRRLLGGDADGYYQDFRGSVSDLAEILRKGWLFTGQYSKYFDEDRGTDPSTLSPEHFVFFLQNHDQIGNRASGKRIHHQINAASFRAATALLLLAPQSPLLFMGEEWGASSPFRYFTDHKEELGRSVWEGRQREFARFAGLPDLQQANRIPDPQAETTFLQSRLDWEEVSEAPHAQLLQLHRVLLRLRLSNPAWSTKPSSIDVPNENAIVVRHKESSVSLIVQLKGAGSVVVSSAPEILLSTEDEQFTGDPIPPVFDATKSAFYFPRPAAIVVHHRID